MDKGTKALRKKIIKVIQTADRETLQRVMWLLELFEYKKGTP